MSIAQVHAALAYYHDNRDEVRQMIREDDAIIQKLRDQVEGSIDRGGSTDASPTVSS